MVDIDRALRRLAEDPVPSRLAATEALVLGKISGPTSTHDVPVPFRVAAVTAALAMGIAGGLLPSQSAKAEQTVTLIGAAGELAPSSLLMGRR